MNRSQRYTYGRRSKRSSSRVLRIIDFILLIATIILAMMLMLAYLSRYVNPGSVWAFSFFGLAAPILYILNLLMAFYWIIRWRKYAFVPVLTLILGVGFISLFFRPALSKKYDHDNPKAVKVMTFNVMGFMTETDGRLLHCLDSLTRFVRNIGPDILCMQEFQATSEIRKHYIDSVLNLQYSRWNYVITNERGGGWGVALYSRYPIINSGSINYPNSVNSSMWADIVSGRDTIRVFNNHLQTTSVNSNDMEFLNTQAFLVPMSEREDRVRSIVSKMKRNNIVRANQVDSLSMLIHSSPYPVIVCGDFNDPPMSYTYRTVRGELKDAFVEKGTGLPYTFKGLFNLFRIDYILHSRSIHTLSYTSPEEDFSDHKPVVAELDLTSISE